MTAQKEPTSNETTIPDKEANDDEAIIPEVAIDNETTAQRETTEETAITPEKATSESTTAQKEPTSESTTKSKEPTSESTTAQKEPTDDVVGDDSQSDGNNLDLSELLDFDVTVLRLLGLL